MASPPKPYGFGTIAVHAGQSADKWEAGQVVPPISLATTYKQLSAGKPKVHAYTRDGNPTRDVLQESLAALETGRFCRVFSSGLATVSAISSMFKTGDHVVLSSDVYDGTSTFFNDIASKRHGLSISNVDLTNNHLLNSALKPETKLIWFESPTNPLLKIIDIAKVIETVRKFNSEIVIVVDNTFMTPYFQRPLEIGADIVMASLTKYINGHSDVCMGAAITRRADLDHQLCYIQFSSGSIPSPFDCYLVNRGIKTLKLRMKAHEENGLAIAEWLESNPRIEKVLYPALKSHPNHHIHQKQTSGMSGMLSFYLRGGLKESETFLASLKVFMLAESLGGFESLAKLPFKMAHANQSDEELTKSGFTPNLIRLSVGIEDKEDLIEDLDQALKEAIHL